MIADLLLILRASDASVYTQPSPEVAAAHTHHKSGSAFLHPLQNVLHPIDFGLLAGDD